MCSKLLLTCYHEKSNERIIQNKPVNCRSLPTRSKNSVTPPPVAGSLGLSATSSVGTNVEPQSELLQSEVTVPPVTSTGVNDVPDEHTSDIRVSLKFLIYNNILCNFSDEMFDF